MINKDQQLQVESISLFYLQLLVLIIQEAKFVEDKICMGTECEGIKSSTSDKEDGQVEGKSNLLDAFGGRFLATFFRIFGGGAI